MVLWGWVCEAWSAHQIRVAVSLGLQPQRLLTFHLVQGSASLRNEICPSCTARLHRSSKLSLSIGLAHHHKALESLSPRSLGDSPLWSGLAYRHHEPKGWSMGVPDLPTLPWRFRASKGLSPQGTHGDGGLLGLAAIRPPARQPLPTNPASTTSLGVPTRRPLLDLPPISGFRSEAPCSFARHP